MKQILNLLFILIFLLSNNISTIKATECFEEIEFLECHFSKEAVLFSYCSEHLKDEFFSIYYLNEENNSTKDKRILEIFLDIFLPPPK